MRGRAWAGGGAVRGSLRRLGFFKGAGAVRAAGPGANEQRRRRLEALPRLADARPRPRAQPRRPRAPVHSGHSEVVRPQEGRVGAVNREVEELRGSGRAVVEDDAPLLGPVEDVHEPADRPPEPPRPVPGGGPPAGAESARPPPRRRRAGTDAPPLPPSRAAPRRRRGGAEGGGGRGGGPGGAEDEGRGGARRRATGRLRGPAVPRLDAGVARPLLKTFHGRRRALLPPLPRRTTLAGTQGAGAWSAAPCRGRKRPAEPAEFSLR